MTLRVGTLIAAALLWAGMVLAYSSEDTLAYATAAVVGILILTLGLIFQFT